MIEFDHFVRSRISVDFGSTIQNYIDRINTLQIFIPS